jgi:hypothetical protein
MRTLPALAALLITSTSAFAAGPCQIFHGRATYSSANGMFRIWHIGTHHTFMPDDLRTPDNTDFSPSWNKIMDLLTDNERNPRGGDDTALFADFVVCPTEPLHQGASQPARVLHIYHPHVVPRDHDGEAR